MGKCSGNHGGSRTDKITRRKFVGAAGAVASAAVVGCRTGGETELKDVPSVQLASIMRAAIYPGIGVARIGNSTARDGFFIGPEVVEPPRTQRGGSRDATGALKRQAARFRIYGLDAEGRGLAWWHPLVSGDPETVVAAGISVRGRVFANEDEVPDDEVTERIVAWPLRWPRAARERATK